MTEIERIRHAIERNYIFDQPGEVVSERQEDEVILLASIASLQAQVEALRELVAAERDLPLNMLPDYKDPQYIAKHERARVAREKADMPLLPRKAALAAEKE
jgi:hypothetical protein